MHSNQNEATFDWLPFLPLLELNPYEGSHHACVRVSKRDAIKIICMHNGVNDLIRSLRGEDEWEGLKVKHIVI